MSVSILIPTYNRKHFSKLISLNINSQTYPLIKEVIVADDGDEKINLDIQHTLLYYKVERMSIGEKRNFLKNKASGDYLIHFDTDDFYNPNYISNSVYNLIKSGKQLSGSSDMIMYDGKSTYTQSCIYLNYINEATMCYTKTYSKLHDFKCKNSSEGLDFCELKHINQLNIKDIMICLCHKGNTIDKSVWLKDGYKQEIDMSIYKNHLNLNII